MLIIAEVKKKESRLKLYLAMQKLTMNETNFLLIIFFAIQLSNSNDFFIGTNHVWNFYFAMT